MSTIQITSTPAYARMSKKQLLEALEAMHSSQAQLAEQLAEAKSAPQTASRGIGARCVELLTQTAYYEDTSKPKSDSNRVPADHANAGTVGYSYDEILVQIAAEFPGSKTKVASLRWYAAKMNSHAKGYEGHTMPRRRPRSG